MKKVLGVLFVVLMLIPANIMLGRSKDLYWSDVTQLSWKDYKKSADKHSKRKAKSNMGIVILPSQKDDHTMLANVYAVFNTETSTKPNEDGQTDDALHHEQIRFDLAELHARMERKQLPDSTYKTTGKFYVIAQKINKEANKAFMEESKKYDEETKFGDDAAAQKKWDQYVQDQLNKFGDYTGDNAIELEIEQKITKEN